MSLLTEGNSKLGNDICSWNLPAREDICVGSTKLCSKACYAKKGFFNMPDNRIRYEENYEASKRPDFAEKIIAELSTRKEKILRLHTKGDFYSVPYAKAWLEIMKACPDVIFFFYTRSWVFKKFEAVFDEMLALPNVRGWFSYDKSSKPRKNIEKYQWAYMSMDDDDIAENANLVFRVKRTTVQRLSNSIIVCPAENGVKNKKKTTCSKCKICWQNRKVKKKNADSKTR